MDMYGVMPRYLGDVLSDVFIDFVNSEKEKRYARLQSLYRDKTEDVVKRARVKNMNVYYEGVMYDNIADACAELTGSKSQYSAFFSYCYDELGVTFSKIYEEDIRSAIFAEYIDHKSTLHRGLEVVYNGVTYKTIKSACADVGVSEAGFYEYCITKYKNNAKGMSRNELSKAFEEYTDRYVGKVGYTLSYNGKDYTSVMNACIDAGVSYSSFRNFCRRISGKDTCDLSTVERGALLGEYVKSKGVSYKGKVYKNVKSMCESEGVSHPGFIRYCKRVYGNTPAKMGSCSLENALIDYMGLKSNNTSPCAIVYKGKNYSSTLCACREVGITRTSFTSFCCRVTGKVFHELSVEERSRLFETYARAKGKF